MGVTREITKTLHVSLVRGLAWWCDHVYTAQMVCSKVLMAMGCLVSPPAAKIPFLPNNMSSKVRLNKQTLDPCFDLFIVVGHPVSTTPRRPRAKSASAKWGIALAGRRSTAVTRSRPPRSPAAPAPSAALVRPLPQQRSRKCRAWALSVGCHWGPL